MIKLLALIILLCNLCYFCDCGTLSSQQQAEQTLITTLLNGYKTNIRPDDQVSIDITATIQQIVTIDEKQQVMTSSSFISQTWFDDRLSWDPNTASGIEVVMLPVKSLWIPDTMVLNSADASGYLTISDYSLASVYYSGQVYMILPVLSIRTRCPLFVQDFPFDRQICSINLTSWSQGSNRLLYTENSSLVIDTSQYSEHALWKLNGTDMVVYRSADRAPFEDTYNDVISIQLYLQRKPLFFILNGIFACLILNCVTLISFTIPFAVQISLCMICFMTYSVYSLNFSSLFPQQSDYIMMITLYFLLSICWTLISMAWFVICNYYSTKGEMPKSMYVFCGRLQRMFSSCSPRPKKGDKTTDKKKEIIAENGELKKSEDKESTTATSSQKMNGVSSQTLFGSCLERHNKVESIDQKQHIAVEGMEPIQTNPTDVTPIATLAYISIEDTNEKAKPKCNFCNRCQTCQGDIDKEKATAKHKKDIAAKYNALNYFVLFWVVLLMFISNLALWLVMANN